MAWDFDDKPLLVFWESTRACGLACRHCRAAAIAEALPGELTHAEGIDLIDQVAGFGRPSPILILTGGDVLRRHRLWDLIDHAHSQHVNVAVSPSVTPLLTEDVIRRLVDSGVDSMSLSLDSSTASGHDGLRGVPGTRNRTLELISFAAQMGLRVQINTTVMDWNIDELPLIFRQIHDLGAKVWEVFFLIHEGRGTQMIPASPEQCESVCRFLVASSTYGIVVRTVEAPFFRRVALEPEQPSADPLANRLIDDLQQLMGPVTHRARNKSACTRDGKGIVFIDYQGNVSPSGFLPIVAGNLREATLAGVYRNQELFRQLRLADAFNGKCGRCTYRDLCGGSRARAYSYSQDPLGEDPACVYQPEGTPMALFQG